MKLGTKIIERKLAAATRDGRRLKIENVTGAELADLLADIDKDYADRTGGVSEALWQWAHANLKDEIDEQRKKHFAQETRQKKEQEKLDLETLAANNAGTRWAPVVFEWLKDRAFEVNGGIFYPLDLKFWLTDFQKIVAESNERRIPLDNPENVIDIVRNLAKAGELHMCDLMTGETITGTALLNYEPLMLKELLKPTEQRRDMRSAEQFDREDPALRAERARIDAELMAARMAEEISRFLAVEPSYAPSEANRRAILDYIKKNDLFFNAENVRRAFHELYEAGKVSRIPNVEIEAGVTSARVWPQEEKDNSDEARDFRMLVQKMSGDDFDARVASDSDFRKKVELYL